MKNSEDAIERVLGAMRASAVPDGLERRVLAGVRARAAESATSGMRGWVLAGSSGVLVVAVALGIGGRRGAVTVQEPIAGNAVAGPVAAAQTGAAPARVITAKHANTLPQVAAGVAAPPSESLEMQEMHAASVVAPALPLTAEERLLRRIAERPGAVLMATAEPVEQAERVEPEKSLKPVFLPGFEETTQPAGATEVEQTGSG